MGQNCCIFGFPCECDLVTMGENVCVNHRADYTPHTVEYLTLRFDPVEMASDSTLMPGSILMPGARLGAGATLLEHSLLLKGDKVDSGEIYCGAPANRVWQPSEK